MNQCFLDKGAPAEVTGLGGEGMKIEMIETMFELMCSRDDGRGEYCQIRVEAIMPDPPTTCKALKDGLAQIGCCAKPLLKMAELSLATMPADAPTDPNMEALKAVMKEQCWADAKANVPPCVKPGEVVKVASVSIAVKNVKCAYIETMYATYADTLFALIAAQGVPAEALSFGAATQTQEACMVTISARGLSDTQTDTIKTKLTEFFASTNGQQALTDLISSIPTGEQIDSSKPAPTVDAPEVTEVTETSDISTLPPKPLPPAASSTAAPGSSTAAPGSSTAAPVTTAAPPGSSTPGSSIASSATSVAASAAILVASAFALFA
jgi:hypothetical protein